MRLFIVVYKSLYHIYIDTIIYVILFLKDTADNGREEIPPESQYVSDHISDAKSRTTQKSADESQSVEEVKNTLEYTYDSPINTCIPVPI
jgi:hypothetical protein